MTTPTNYVIRQQIKKIATSKSLRVSANTGGSTSTGVEENEEKAETQVTLQSKQFRKLGKFGAEVICTDGTHAQIMQPMPCMKWGSKKSFTSNGEVTLSNILNVTVLTVGEKSVCLGFDGTDCGVNTELEVLIDLGDTELIMNNEYYSVKAKHHAKNGVELE